MCHCLDHKHETKLERHARNKHSSLVRTWGVRRFLGIGPWPQGQLLARQDRWQHLVLPRSRLRRGRRGRGEKFGLVSDPFQETNHGKKMMARVSKFWTISLKNLSSLHFGFVLSCSTRKCWTRTDKRASLEKVYCSGHRYFNCSSEKSSSTRSERRWYSNKLLKINLRSSLSIQRWVR